MNLFSTEQVSKWHPDKACDQVSDAILTAYLEQDKHAHCGVETMWKNDTVVLAGEIASIAELDHRAIVKRVATKLGYQANAVIDLISRQSPEINRAVSNQEKIGAGDQGMMYGYACRESASLLPFGFDLANRIIRLLSDQVPAGILQGDMKTQVTVDSSKKEIDSVQKILISACHNPQESVQDARDFIEGLMEAFMLPKHVELIINPAGKWTIGGPTADAGLTGRKIVCDQYGGYCPVGGGAFSGKDPTKVDRSGAYAAREIACDLVTHEDLEWCEIQLAYAIGVPEPVSIHVNNDKGVDFSEYIRANYDLTPKGMIQNLKLDEKNYERIAEGCHYRDRI